MPLSLYLEVIAMTVIERLKELWNEKPTTGTPEQKRIAEELRIYAPYLGLVGSKERKEKTKHYIWG